MHKIQLIRPYISYDDIEDDFKDIFKSGMFTKGKNVAAFQQEFKDYLETQHCSFTTSATTALWVCLKLLNITHGDEVLVADFSFPASSNVIEDLGATPIFVDVLKTTYNMCPDDLQKKITPKTKAVMFVDALGNPTGVTDIQKICTDRNIPLIEDAACAFGSEENGIKCGAISDLTCFSFHPRKLMCTGEGGAITTNNQDWAEWLRVKLNHGASSMQGTGLDFTDYGYNFRLSELQAVMGRKQIPIIDDIINERQEMQRIYNNALEPLGFIAQFIAPNVKHNVQSLVFTVPKNMDRDGLILYLKENNIEASLGTYSLSAMTYNKNKYNNIQPTSDYLFKNTIAFPCYKDVDIDYVINIIKKYQT